MWQNKDESLERYALVTGTSSGLGLEIANYLLDENFVVFGVSRNGTNITHGHFVDIVADICSESSVEEMFEVVRGMTDGIDILVNNAGICEMAPVEEISSREFSDHLNYNVLGSFHVLKHFRSFVIENISHVITVSSAVAKTGYQELSAYVASKSSLEGLINVCRQEWNKHGVRFSTLTPGFMNTEDVPIECDKVMSTDDFIHVFEMIIKSPNHVHFPEIVFSHKDEGYLQRSGQ